jgi:renalase
VPQSLDLLGAGGTLEAFDGTAVAALRTVSYDPCFALMLVLGRPSLVPEPGRIQFQGGPISWVSDNQRKGISLVPALTAHAARGFSRERFDGDAFDGPRVEGAAGSGRAAGAWMAGILGAGH